MPEKRKVACLDADQDGGPSGKSAKNSSPTLQVLIVGCGIGGLAAGIACKKGGHEVTLLEQASGFQEIGAGIQLPPNATRALRSLDLLSDIEVASAKPSHIALRSYRDSAILSVQNLVPFAHNHYGAPYLVVHRADLVRIMVQKAVSLGIIIKLSSIVTEYDFVESSLLTSDGTKYTSDFILGCDGERSLARKALTEIADSPESSGDTVFRLTVEYSKLRQDPDLKYLVESPHVNAWLGPHAHAVSYPLERQELLNVVLTEHHSGAELVSPRTATVDELSNRLKEWDPTVVRLFTLAQPMTKWTLLQPRKVHKWTHSSGTFALLGDSAHAALPFLAQGAAQAIEDAAVLGALLANVGSDTQIPAILSRYESIRKPRTDTICFRSQAMKDIVGMPNGVLQEERDQRLKERTPTEGHPNPWADPVFQEWLFGYDTSKEAMSA